MDIRNYFKNKPVPPPCEDLEEDDDIVTARLEPATSGVSVGVVSDILIESRTSTKVSSINANETQSSTQSQMLQKELDLSNKGEPIKQVVLDEYPKQSNNRSFRAVWYKRFNGLQYSVSKDATFCYACMNFNKTGSKELAFTENGFRNWKNALHKYRGFPKHESTLVHVESMKLWKEKEIRVSSSSSVSTLVNDTILEKKQILRKKHYRNSSISCSKRVGVQRILRFG